MRFIAAALAAVLTIGEGAIGQVATPPQAPDTVQPPAPVVPAPVVPPLPLGARTFTGTSGLIFNAVRPDRVVDFELVIGYLQAAFEKSTDARVREQAQGWRVFKASEPGPNGSVVYVFVIDPAVPGADYGLGRILADAYPDQIEKIWSLYTGAQAQGGSLLNLTRVQPPSPLAPPSSAAPAAPAAAPRPAPPVTP